MSRQSKILIVDDDPMSVDLLEQELEDLGYETVSANNGKEALQRIADEAPDLILLDVMMPVMDGFRACRILKESEKTRLIPVVIMTALHEIENRIKGIEAGADDYLIKPVDNRALQARIRTALKLRHSWEKKIQDVHHLLDHYSKFVPEIVKRIIRDNPEAPELGKREQDATVLFVDICEFTLLSEIMAPDSLNNLVEHYFSAYMDRIHEFGGDVSETAGDGLMAIFHGKGPEIHARMATDTAMALFCKTKAINEKGTGPSLALHMGINSGVASVGSTRFDGLRGTRWVFTAGGFMTNLAARLAGTAEANEILIGPETVKLLENRYPLKWLGSKRLKNITEPVDIHRIVP